MKNIFLIVTIGLAVCAPLTATAQMTPMNACVAKKARYVESASRKLYRALVSKGYSMKDVGLDPSFIAGSSGGEESQKYIAYPQHEGSVVGVVAQASSVKNSYVVANTTRGHVIAVINWSAGCHPIGSDIAHPRVAQTEVDMEPFKFWGLRLLWNLPRKLGQGRSVDALSAIINKQ